MAGVGYVWLEWGTCVWSGVRVGGGGNVLVEGATLSGTFLQGRKDVVNQCLELGGGGGTSGWRGA